MGRESRRRQVSICPMGVTGWRRVKVVPRDGVRGFWLGGVGCLGFVRGIFWRGVGRGGGDGA